MKTLIWLVFAVLSAIWTGLVALTLQLSHWLLATVASSQVPGAYANAVPWTPPAWAEPWADTAMLESLQSTVAWLTQLINQVLPAFGGISTVVSVVGWVIWGMVMAAMLAVALALHWAASRRNARASAQSRLVG